MKFYFLDSRLRGKDTLGLAPGGEATCFIRLKCYETSNLPHFFGFVDENKERSPL